MNKIIKIVTVVTMSLIVVGCSTQEPMVKIIKKDVVEIDGKKYAVPEGTNYTRQAVTPKVIKFYQSIGLKECQDGDITWEEEKTAEAINTIMRTGTKDEGIAVYKKAATEGKVGCAHPLS